jgi:hypothetical protein
MYTTSTLMRESEEVALLWLPRGGESARDGAVVSLLVPSRAGGPWAAAGARALARRWRGGAMRVGRSSAAMRDLHVLMAGAVAGDRGEPFSVTVMYEAECLSYYRELMYGCHVPLSLQQIKIVVAYNDLYLYFTIYRCIHA